MKTENMHVLLTGACGGIGRAVARQFARKGASLYLTGRDRNKLEDLSKEIEPLMHNGKCPNIKAIDLSDDHQVDNWIKEIEQKQYPINVVINCAGISRFELFEKTQPSDIEKIIGLNTIAPIKLIRKLIPVLKTQPESRVVNIGSTFGAIGFPGYSVYSASKYALKGFSEALGRELSDSNISVGCFMPRATHTSINNEKVIEFNRQMNVSMDSPEKVAKAIQVFTCSTKNITGIGWPERFLMPLNSILPSVVGNAIQKKLPLIKRYAR